MRACLCALVGLTAMLMAAAACAGDRPYLITSSAAAEEDDDGVWSIESAASKLGSRRGLELQAEYAFNPTQALQLELGHGRGASGQASDSSAGLQYRQLFNHIARDGWGWGLVLAAELDKSGSAAWRAGSTSLTLPVSIQWAGLASLLHANLGVAWPRGERRQWLASLAASHDLGHRTHLFAEVARQGDERLLHGGVRHWLRREKLALDFSLQRRHGAGEFERGVVVGLGWYDL